MTTSDSLPLVAILRGVTPDDVLVHMAELYRAGFTQVAIPLNSPNWQQSIVLAVKHYGDRMRIGAGTVTTPREVAILKEAGCEFILTPNTDISVIKAATSAGMATCIGCLTASEALTALRHGASMLKIFPAGDVGPGYIRSLRAILPSNTRLYAVGGITATNLADYLRAGCEGAGLGSDLYRAEQSQAETAEKAQRFIHAWRAWQA
ncbi:TPA: 2-dehydro-3-deoxy-6-phosphogalactonate aldolase [Raoultella planticola]|nr:2-dehydro-3-deoxy-6-phosphogalactonate aldolase [Raoultella planticola]